MIALVSVRRFPGDRRRGVLDPPNLSTVKTLFADLNDALQKAEDLEWNEKERQRKNPRQMPALINLWIELHDGTRMDRVTIRREAAKVRD